jgi:hypothetical protein
MSRDVSEKRAALLQALCIVDQPEVDLPGSRLIAAINMGITF